MKVKRSDFLSALRKVKPGLASSESIEQSTSFVFRDGRVITYNDEIAVSAALDLGGIEGAVGANELVALLTKSKDEEVTVTAEDKELRIKGPKLSAGITMEAEINLPILSFEPKEGFYVLPDAFLDGLRVCIFSAASESVSPVLSNIHMKGSFVESCDNFRLTRFDLKEDSEDDCLIPAVAAAHLIQTSVSEYGEEGGWMFFREEKTDLVFACRIYNDEFPALDAFLELDKPSEVKLPKELSEVLDRSGIFASTDEKSAQDLVDVNISDNWIKVRSQNARGWVEEKIRAKTKDADFIFSVNPSILQAILKITDKAKLTDRSIHFEAADFTHVVTFVPKSDWGK